MNNPVQQHHDTDGFGIPSAVQYYSPPSPSMLSFPTNYHPDTDDGFFPDLPPTFLSSSESVTPRSPSPAPHQCGTGDERRLRITSLVLQYREIEDRYELCLRHLQDTAREVEALRSENARLRRANTDLIRRINPIKAAPASNPSTAASLMEAVASRYSGAPTPSVIKDFRRLVISGGDEMPGDLSSPRSVLGGGGRRQDALGAQPRVTLPKSISVRSSGYTKGQQSGGANSKRSGRVCVASPVLVGSPNVSIPGIVPAVVGIGANGNLSPGAGVVEPDAEAALELEVYNQGMFKTELCNKWEETGTCPYGDHCQFAHGVGELRPVIRHPRYKTEVCRMVLAGQSCPYGHRCHFRHALLPHERCAAEAAAAVAAVA